MELAEQRLYFEKRAAEERAAAAHAEDERAAQPHRELAQRYSAVASGAAEPGTETAGDDGCGSLPPEFTILP